MPHPSCNPIYVAIDRPDLAGARDLVARLHGGVGGIKLGLEFFTANGPSGVAAIVEQGMPVFLDLKFHDIPNTVAGAVREAARLGVAILTVHAGGGPAMLQAAREAAGDAPARPKIVAVTVLTSIDASDLAATGIADRPLDQARRLALLSRDAGLDGVVCSPFEIDAIRVACGDAFMTVVPGIRPSGSALGDQKRAMTPTEARRAGADILVIGRPITAAADPAAAAQAIAAQLETEIPA